MSKSRWFGGASVVVSTASRDDKRLSAAERAELEQCVNIVQRGLTAWSEAGEALTRIRERQLYRETHSTFADFACETFALSRRRLDQLIQSWQILRNLEQSDETEKSISQFRPEQIPEAAIRPLAGLAADDAVAAWSEAVDQSGGAVPSPASVRAAAVRRRPTRRKPATRRPVRFRVPGATVVVIPNKAFSGVGPALEAALSAVRAAANTPATSTSEAA
jgi:hypothetical protein